MNSDIHRLLDEAFAGHRDDARRAGPEGRGARQPRRAHRRARGRRAVVGGCRAPGDRRARRRARAAGRRPTAPVRAKESHADAAAASPRAPEARIRRRRSSSPRSSPWRRLIVVALAATGVLPLPVAGTIVVLALGAVGCGLDRRRRRSRRRRRTEPSRCRPGAPPASPSRRVSSCSGSGSTGLVAGRHPRDVGRRPRRARRGRWASSCSPSSARRRPTGTRRGSWRRSATRRCRPTASRRSPRPQPGSASTRRSSGIVTFAVIVVLVFTVGWWWALLAFVGGFAVMMLVLARMMFGPKKS